MTIINCVSYPNQFIAIRFDGTETSVESIKELCERDFTCHTEKSKFDGKCYLKLNSVDRVFYLDIGKYIVKDNHKNYMIITEDKFQELFYIIE